MKLKKPRSLPDKNNGGREAVDALLILLNIVPLKIEKNRDILEEWGLRGLA